jgi:hypothetical protein
VGSICYVPGVKWPCIILWNVAFLWYISGFYAVSERNKLYHFSFCISMPVLVCAFGTT